MFDLFDLARAAIDATGGDPWLAPAFIGGIVRGIFGGSKQKTKVNQDVVTNVDVDVNPNIGVAVDLDLDSVGAALDRFGDLAERQDVTQRELALAQADALNKLAEGQELVGQQIADASAVQAAVGVARLQSEQERFDRLMKLALPAAAAFLLLRNA